jgi:hypothetical protein
MNELERIEETKDKFSDFQSKYNTTTKSIAHIFGTNMALFICLLLPIFLIGTVWTDFGAPQFTLKFVSEGIVTVALFIVGESLMMRVGADGGKLDPEYTTARDELATLIEKVNEVGTMLMGVFCEWQTDIELKQATESRLRRLRMTPEELEKVRRTMDRGQIVKTFGNKKAALIIDYFKLEPIELNDTVLLYDDAFDKSRGGVPIGGERYIRNKMLSPKMILSCIFTGLVTVSVVMTLTTDASFSRAMYTVFKLIILLFRMALGYNTGAKAYNTVEARQLKAKSHYLREYLRFVHDKTYLKIGDQYGDVSCFLNEDAEDSSPWPLEDLEQEIPNYDDLEQAVIDIPT